MIHRLFLDKFFRIYFSLRSRGSQQLNPIIHRVYLVLKVIWNWTNKDLTETVYESINDTRGKIPTGNNHSYLVGVLVVEIARKGRGMVTDEKVSKICESGIKMWMGIRSEMVTFSKSVTEEWEFITGKMCRTNRRITRNVKKSLEVVRRTIDEGRGCTSSGQWE